MYIAAVFFIAVMGMLFSMAVMEVFLNMVGIKIIQMCCYNFFVTNTVDVQ